MADIFQTSVSGMLAYQKALATTSHNINNINTPGFSRQRTDFATLTPSLVAGGWLGAGVGVESITRMADELRSQSVRVNSSEHGRLDSFRELSGRIDSLLADKDAGLAPAMQAFFNSVQAASVDPSDSTARNVMLTEAQNLASRFHFLDSRLTELDAEVNSRIDLVVDEINELAGGVARLNRDIAIALGRSAGAPPNDLLDQRDALLERISERVGTQVLQHKDGTVSVFIGNGQALVTGAETNRLTTVGDEYERSRREIAFVSNSGPVNISRNIAGGSLGGLLDFRRESLDVIRNELGQTATALTIQFNQQHRMGVSFDGGRMQAGGDFFKMQNAQVLASNRNGGSGQPTVTINPDQLGDLTSSDYRLQFNNGSWQLTRLDDGTRWTVPANPAPDGLVIGNFPANPVNGDSFQIRPTRQAAMGMDVAITRPSEIAWANPALAGEATGPNGEAINTGSGKIGGVAFTGDVAAYMQSGEVTLTYRQDADGAGNPGFMIGAGPGFIPYDGTPASHDIAVAGGSIRIDLAGVPAEGDVFVIQPNRQGRGDNANLLALANIKDKAALKGGDSTLHEFYSGMVGRAGAQSLRANINLEAQQVLLDQAQAARDSVSGVNLDEEAANMLRYQQAFQASAQLIVVANTLFHSLLDAVGR
jgi:flagellar hook-associated protein 1 FlgK